MKSRLAVVLVLVLAAVLLGARCGDTATPGPLPTPTPSVVATPTPRPTGVEAECSKIGHEHRVFAATAPKIGSQADIEAFDGNALDAHVLAASLFRGSVWGYDDIPSQDLADAVERYWSSLQMARAEYDIDGRVPPHIAAVVWQGRLEIRDDYAAFARDTCHAGSGP